MKFEKAGGRVGAVAEPGELHFDKRQPFQFLGDVVSGLVPAYRFEPIGHRLSGLDEQGRYGAAVVVRGVVGGRTEFWETRGLDASASHRLEARFDEDAGS